MKIPVNSPLLDGNEKKYLEQCIETGWISSEGPFVAEFESKFAEFSGRKYGIAVSNGTVALELAVKAAGIESGDEVILPAFTIISCAAAVVRNGAVPVLVDSDPETWNMDVTRIEEKITTRTRAIMVVHIYGLPVDMDPVLQLAEKYNLKIIEDAAEAHGLTYKGRRCGSFGDISIFSFYPNKLITTGEGGMIVTDNKEMAEKARLYRNLCFIPEHRFYHEELGWNFRMNNLQAALGMAQLERADEFIEKKHKMGEFYYKHLKDSKSFKVPVTHTDYAKNIYWVFGLLLNENGREVRENIVKNLAAAGVGTRPFFWPMHEQPVFHKMNLFLNESYPVAEKLARSGFYIPSGLALTSEEMEYVVEKVKKLLP